MDRERWRLFCRGHRLGDVLRGNESSETMDRYTAVVHTRITQELKTMVENSVY